MSNELECDIFTLECDIFTFEEALERFQAAGEQFGHLSPVFLTYFKGGFTLSYQKEDERTENND